MFVVLITSIANAQSTTFDFGCTSAEVRTNRLAQLADLVGQYGVTSIAPFESSSTSTEDFVSIAYSQDGNPLFYPISTSVNLLEDVTDWGTKYSEFVAKLIADEFTGPTLKSELTAIYADGTTPPVLTDLINNTSDTAEASTDSSDFFKSLGADSGYTVVSFSADEIGFYFRIDAIGAPKIYSEVENINTPASHRAFTLQIVKHIWDLLYPNYDPNAAANAAANAAIAQAIADIYTAAAPPTAFNDLINNAAGDAYLGDNTVRRAFASKFDNYDLTFDTFEQRSDNKHYAVYTNDDIPGIVLPGGGTTFNDANFKLWMLEIAKAIWLKGHPEYAALAPYEQELIAIYTSNVYPTELGSVINDAALAVEFGIAGNTPRSNFIKSLAYFNVTVSGVYDSNGNPSEAHLSNSNVVPNIGTNASTSSMTPAQFAVFTFEVVKRFWHIGHPEAAIAAKRAERIAEIAVLSDASANVIITDYIDPDDGDTFIFNVLGDPNLQPEYNTTTYQGGVKSFGSLGTTQWINMRSDISAKITEINDDVTERNIRINVLVKHSTDDVTVGARWSSLRGDLFDIDNGQTTVQIYANDYDLPLVVDGYTRLENLTNNGVNSELNALDAAIALKVGDLDPANAIYGFYPSEFYAASAEEKVNKAFDIAKANYVAAAVSGSFVKGFSSKITLQISAKNYPLNILAEMAIDADYEGWKTLIDRILYLVTAGDGSSAAARATEINVEQASYSDDTVITATNWGVGNSNPDWGIDFDGLQFISGGHDNISIESTFNKHHVDNLGLLTGVVYESLIVEITRIRSLVIAADGLERDTNQRETHWSGIGNAQWFHGANEWVLIGNNNPFYSDTNYGSQNGAQCVGYSRLRDMDNYNWRYLFILAKNELLKQAGTTYYNHLPQNVCTP